MDSERKMEYYFFIVEKQKKTREEMNKEGKKKDTYKFVSEFDIEDGVISGSKTS